MEIGASYYEQKLSKVQIVRLDLVLNCNIKSNNQTCSISIQSTDMSTSWVPALNISRIYTQYNKEFTLKDFRNISSPGLKTQIRIPHHLIQKVELRTLWSLENLLNTLWAWILKCNHG